jgi:hypothetical protein
MPSLYTDPTRVTTAVAADALHLIAEGILGRRLLEVAEGAETACPPAAPPAPSEEMRRLGEAAAWLRSMDRSKGFCIETEAVGLLCALLLGQWNARSQIVAWCKGRDEELGAYARKLKPRDGVVPWLRLLFLKKEVLLPGGPAG